MATAHDLSMLTGDELGARLGDSRRELFNLRFQLATGQLDNPARIPQVKRDVARMLTVLRTREILEAEGAYVAPTEAEHEAARAKLEAEDAAQVEKDEARRAAAEADGDGVGTDDEFDEDQFDDDEFNDDEFNEEEEA
jgi:large subunit ribosomal protein L29